jgi:hypothetical protein
VSRRRLAEPAIRCNRNACLGQGTLVAAESASAIIFISRWRVSSRCWLLAPPSHRPRQAPRLRLPPSRQVRPTSRRLPRRRESRHERSTERLHVGNAASLLQAQNRRHVAAFRVFSQSTPHPPAVLVPGNKVPRPEPLKHCSWPRIQLQPNDHSFLSSQRRRQNRD